MADNSYSTRKISEKLLNEIVESVQSVKGWGSIEIFIQNNIVTQITEKNIKKPKVDILTRKIK
jgi:hypothetical protein